MAKYVTYLRLSRDSKNGRNYGLDAQRRDLDVFMDQSCPSADGCEEIASYQEIETAVDDDRPELQKAIAHCKRENACLVVARLDRLSRKVSFISKLTDDKKLSFKVACMPHADKFQLHIYAALAEQERDFISKRTKAALRAARKRGVVLGGLRGDKQEKANQRKREIAEAKAERLRDIVQPWVDKYRRKEATLMQIAEALSKAGVKTSRGADTWSATQVSRLIKRLAF